MTKRASTNNVRSPVPQTSEIVDTRNTEQTIQQFRFAWAPHELPAGLHSRSLSCKTRYPLDFTRDLEFGRAGHQCECTRPSPIELSLFDRAYMSLCSSVSAKKSSNRSGNIHRSPEEKKPAGDRDTVRPTTLPPVRRFELPNVCSYPLPPRSMISETISSSRVQQNNNIDLLVHSTHTINVKRNKRHLLYSILRDVGKQKHLDASPTSRSSLLSWHHVPTSIAKILLREGQPHN